MQEQPIPNLREELALHEAARTAQGQPTWVIEDPSTNRFYQIDRKTYEVLIRFHLGTQDAVAEAVCQETPFQVDAEFVMSVVKFLVQNQLVQPNATSSVQEMMDKRKKKQAWYLWMLHHYLFFRVPLVRPDGFLDATVKFVRPLYSRFALYLAILCFLSGVFLISRQWDVFAASVVDMFSLQGLAYFMVALSISKVGHELGHAYMAKIHGCRVPAMGVAFLVLWPMLYTDTNQTWKLKSRKARLSVGMAGMTVELVLACIATFLWSFLPDGGFKDLCLVLATTAWVSSLLINISPFMRFDGYYVLSDVMGIPNLHSRSFALSRWKLREVLFNLGQPAPERFSPRRQRFLILFGYGVWIYRLLLFLGIAVMVYSFFIKIVGILLFIVEILWFVVKPVWGEVKVWHSMREEIVQRRRVFITAGLMVLAFGATFVPWSTTVTAPAMVHAAQSVQVFAPQEGILREVLPTFGEKVEAGQRLTRLEDPSLDLEENILLYRKKRLEYERTLPNLSDEYRNHSDTVLTNWVRNNTELDIIAQRRQSLEVVSPMSGYWLDVNTELSTGQWVAQGTALGRVASFNEVAISAYVYEQDVSRLSQDMECRFSSVFAEVFHHPCTVQEIETLPVSVLPDPELASINGGMITTLSDREGVVPDKNVFRVKASLHFEDGAPFPAYTGQVILSAERKSLAQEAYHKLMAILIKESNW